MSSHIFEEVENTCDRILMVKDGNLVADKGIQDIRNANKKHYTITFLMLKSATGASDYVILGNMTLPPR